MVFGAVSRLHSRARGVEAVHEVDGVPVGVEAVDERVVLLDAQPVPPDVRHGSLCPQSPHRQTYVHCTAPCQSWARDNWAGLRVFGYSGAGVIGHM